MQYDSLGRPQFGKSAFASLVIVFMIIVGVALIVGIIGSTCSNITERTHDLAQAEADKYLKTTGLVDNQGAVAICVNIDSDNDGYVSCPYVTKDGITHPLECAGSMTINSGCRPPKAAFTQPVQFPAQTPR